MGFNFNIINKCFYIAIMKKTYKPKEKDIIKLKRYLTNKEKTKNGK